MTDRCADPCLTPTGCPCRSAERARDAIAVETGTDIYAAASGIARALRLIPDDWRTGRLDDTED